VGRPRLGFSYDAWSSGLHGVLMFFATCSVAGWARPPPSSSSTTKNSTTADVSGGPVMRNARVKARRRIAESRHCWSRCNHAPRPGRLPAESTVTTQSPFPSRSATTRSNSAANSRLRHPTHVRTGPWGCSVRPGPEAEVSRWITAQSSRTGPARGIACRPILPGQLHGLRSARAARPHRTPRRCGCRCATPSGGQPTWRSALPCRSPATAGSPGR
jgi:hypothetical protein